MTLDAFSSRVVVPEGEDRAEVLRAAAEEFLRAGGVVSWDWWAGLGEESRDAFRNAGDRIRQEQAGLTAAGVHAEIIATSLLAGENVDRLVVRDAVRRVSAAAAKSVSAKERP